MKLTRRPTKRTVLAVMFALFGTIGACAPRNAGFDSMQVLLQQRAGLDPEWRRLSGDPAVDRRVEALLASPIGPDEAVNIALLNNADLQASFEELGIARAQLVDASLPANIEVGGNIGGFAGDRQSDFGFAATTELTRLLFLPLRRGVATAGLEATRIETAGVTMDFAYAVRNAFYEYQAAEQFLELDQTVLEAAAASYDAAQRLFDAGNITALQLANERAFYEQARSEMTLAEATALNRREELNAWMGLSGIGTDWRLEGRLSEPVPEDALPDLETLESRAVEDSLDLLGLEYRYTESARRANLARAEGLLPSLRVGAQVGREESLRQTGPVFSIELPLFDQGQARVAAARAGMRQLEQQYRARAVEIRSAVRTARNDLVIATRRVEHFRSVLLPLWEQIINQTQRQYNAMQSGVFELLLARREQVRTGQEYVMALRNYWHARARLDQILAGRLVGAANGAETFAWR
jgi:cobalt-zinc-cadmium efflux system outer membrane protein